MRDVLAKMIYAQPSRADSADERDRRSLLRHAVQQEVISTMPTEEPQRSTAHGGYIPPHEMFNRPLPGRLILHHDRPFEERVELAWQWVKLTRFLEEEHERLREVLAARIQGERRGTRVTG